MYIHFMNTKDTLIETTRELLWELGYSATSPKVIQKRSGIGQGSMYHHFDGKSDLARAAMKRNLQDLKKAAEADFMKGDTAVEKISNFLLRPRNIQMGCRMGKLSQDSAIIQDEAMRKILEEAFSWLENSLANIIKEGQVQQNFSNEVDAEYTASAIAALFQGAYVLARAEASDEPFHRAIKGILCLLKQSEIHGG